MPKKTKKPQRVILTLTDTPTGGFTIEMEFRPTINADSPTTPAVQAALICVNALKAAAEAQ